MGKITKSQSGFFKCIEEEASDVRESLKFVEKKILSEVTFQCVDVFNKKKFEFIVTKVIVTAEDNDPENLGLLSSLDVEIKDEIKFEDATTIDFINLYSETLQTLIFGHYIVMGKNENNETVIAIYLHALDLFRYYVINDKIKVQKTQTHPENN